jgi:hypothetical protein
MHHRCRNGGTTTRTGGMHSDFRRRVVASREAGIADSLQYLHPARGRFEAFAERSSVALPVAISVNHGLNESHKELTLSTLATLSPCPGVDGEIKSPAVYPVAAHDRSVLCVAKAHHHRPYYAAHALLRVN